MLNAADAGRVRPYEQNRFYWQYRGRPVLLLGGSVEDNLFQIDNPAEHLDLLLSAGGNYVRCTMSSRDRGNRWPYACDPASGKYDLSRWDEQYWGCFERFLALTAERDVIVQLEIWATWDLYRGGWARHPCNPANNVNYTPQESGLPTAVEHLPFDRIQPFFETVPDLSDLALVRGFQEAFVDRVLACALGHNHVLYCIDNETNADPRWAHYWARYLAERAAQAGKAVEVTEMWDNWDPSDGKVAGARVQSEADHPHLHRSNVGVTLASPDLYSFVEISNHNTQFGRTHYRTAMWVRNRMAASGLPRPITCVKVYGGDPRLAFSGPAVCGERRFWRNLFAGLSAVRFHRPSAGLGLSETAQAHIRSARALADAMDVFRCDPRPDLLSPSEGDVAYCLANPGRGYAVCFLDGGCADLDLRDLAGRAVVRWLDVKHAAWRDGGRHSGRPPLRLAPPADGFWVAVVSPAG